MKFGLIFIGLLITSIVLLFFLVFVGIPQKKTEKHSAISTNNIVDGINFSTISYPPANNYFIANFFYTNPWQGILSNTF